MKRECGERWKPRSRGCPRNCERQVPARMPPDASGKAAGAQSREPGDLPSRQDPAMPPVGRLETFAHDHLDPRPRRRSAAAPRSVPSPSRWRPSSASASCSWRASRRRSRSTTRRTTSATPRTSPATDAPDTRDDHPASVGGAGRRLHRGRRRDGARTHADLAADRGGGALRARGAVASGRAGAADRSRACRARPRRARCRAGMAARRGPAADGVHRPGDPRRRRSATPCCSAP